MGASDRFARRLLAAVCFLLTVVLTVVAVFPVLAEADGNGGGKIAPWLAARLESGPAEALVLMAGSDARGSGVEGAEAVYRELTNRARRNQGELVRWLEGQGIPYRRYYIIDALLVKVDLDLARVLAARSEVARLVGNPRLRVIEPLNPDTAAPEAGTDGIEWGVEMVGAPAVWNERGVRGEGVVVVSMDTGVDWEHPAIRDKYRGWDAAGGTVDHSYSWHDAIDDSAASWDDHGHGTHTVGTMVGDDGEGNQVGVAPGARWVACRNMDHGVGTPARYIECMEWSLAPYPPGGDPMTEGRPDLAPQVANNSWVCPPSEGCDTQSFDEALANLRRAGLWMVAAAGNDGPNCNTVKDPPAISPDVFTVGAVSSNRVTAFFSSRGPVTIDGSNRLKPDVSAPGDGVRSSVPGGGYSSWSGTSMASPHVAGCAALLWSAVPELRGLLDISECLLRHSAQTPVPNFFPQSCGGISHNTYPNNVAGWGIVNADDALGLPNGDGDIVADVCDCAAADGGSFAVPGEVENLHFSDEQTLVWTSQGPSAGDGTTYDLVRGGLGELLAEGDISSAGCLGDDLGSSVFSDQAVPEAGAGYYYLVRSANGCGASGYGKDFGGGERVNSSCQG